MTTTTSIRLPKDWWDTFQKLSTLRKIQGVKRSSYSLNVLMLEAMEDGVTQMALEVLERSGRKK